MGEEKIRCNTNASRKSRRWRHACSVSCGSDPYPCSPRDTASDIRCLQDGMYPTGIIWDHLSKSIYGNARLIICSEFCRDLCFVVSMSQWIPQDSLSSHITSAVYACNSQLIYATFRDGNIGVFDADTLGLRCRISPSAYLPQV